MAMLQGSFKTVNDEEMKKLLNEQYADIKRSMYVYIDPAEKGADMTVVHPAPSWRDGFGSIKSYPIVKAPELPRQSEPDRIWNLIVLAAESSRYG